MRVLRNGNIIISYVLDKRIVSYEHLLRSDDFHLESRGCWTKLLAVYRWLWSVASQSEIHPWHMETDETGAPF